MIFNILLSFLDGKEWFHNEDDEVISHNPDEKLMPNELFLQRFGCNYFTANRGESVTTHYIGEISSGKYCLRDLN